MFHVAERIVKCMTRSQKNAVMQQMISVDKALQMLDQETPPLVVDTEKLKVCGMKHLSFACMLNFWVWMLCGYATNMFNLHVVPFFLNSSGAVGETGNED